MRKGNFFEEYTWEKVLSLYPKQDISIADYHAILCKEFPGFLKKYISLPILQRLSGVGLLCGTDWTPLYQNRFYYSRLDHSIGVALIVWNFTKNKAQTVAALLHDVSTPVFSHVSDFRKGDALTQTATEEINASLIKNDAALLKVLLEDGLCADEVDDYHKYPVADNEIPCLSADRLEYMFPSGMALEGSWTLKEIEQTYNDITILKNEDNKDELGFKTVEKAEFYCEKFCMTGHLLQLNENKLTLQLLGQIMNTALKENLIDEADFMRLSEKEVLFKLNDNGSKEFRSLYNTFRTMTKIVHSQTPLKGHFCISLKVKQRYINPLVLTKNGSAVRLSEISKKAKTIIEDFLDYEDTPFGCVQLV